MRRLRWLVFPLFMFILTACGSDKTEDEVLEMMDGVFYSEESESLLLMYGASGDYGIINATPGEAEKSLAWTIGLEGQSHNIEEVSPSKQEVRTSLEYFPEEVTTLKFEGEKERVTVTEKGKEKMKFEFVGEWRDAEKFLWQKVREIDGNEYQKDLTKFMNTSPYYREQGYATDMGDYISYIVDISEMGISLELRNYWLFPLAVARYHETKKDILIGYESVDGLAFYFGAFMEDRFINIDEEYGEPIIDRLPKDYIDRYKSKEKSNVKKAKPDKRSAAAIAKAKEIAAANKDKSVTTSSPTTTKKKTKKATTTTKKPTESKVTAESKPAEVKESEAEKTLWTQEGVGEAANALSGTYLGPNGTTLLVLNGSEYKIVDLSAHDDRDEAANALENSRTAIDAATVNTQTGAVQFNHPDFGFLAISPTDIGIDVQNGPLTGLYERVGAASDYGAFLPAAASNTPATLLDYLGQYDFSIYGTFSPDSNGVIMDVTHSDTLRSLDAYERTGTFNDMYWYGLLQQMAPYTTAYPDETLSFRVTTGSGVQEIIGEIQNGNIRDYIAQ